MKRKGWGRWAALILTLAVAATPISAFAAERTDWPQALGNCKMQGINSALTPRTAEETVLRWELSQEGAIANPGAMNWTNMPGTPIIVGDYVYYYRSGYLRKVELTTGEETARVQVYANKTNQFFVYLAYEDGKIFFPCQRNDLGDVDVDGCFLRVYDAETLQQLYVTESFGKGMMETPLTCYDGYITTGVYGKNADYVCFTTEDEDPRSSTEIKKILWSVTAEDTLTSFYGSGAAFAGDYCYFGQDDTIYAVRYKTGEATKFSLGDGYANKAPLNYSEETGRLYISANSPNGAAVRSYGIGADGSLDTADWQEWTSGTEGGGTQSAPVVYGGRLYLGGGGGHGGSSEPFHVLDAVTLEEQYSVPILSKGTPTVSTGYERAEDGAVYIYLVPYRAQDENAQLWIIRDQPDQTEADYRIVSPAGYPQYCYQSVAIGKDGSLIYYNDAGYLYCFARRRNAAEMAADENRVQWAGAMGLLTAAALFRVQR